MFSNITFPFNKIATEEKEGVTLISFSVILFLACIIFAIWLLPKNCELFSNNIMPPQMCHTIPMPKDCHFCENRITASIASMIGVLGVCFIFLPYFVFLMRYWLNRRVQQTKFFD